MVDNLFIRSLRIDDLSMVLAWRNDHRVRLSMFTRHEITAEEHTAWFLKAKLDKTRRQMIVEELGTPIGYVQFSNVSNGGVAAWSFHTAPNSKKGSGKKLGITALNFAFNELNLHKVCGEVLEMNQVSLALHARLGFFQEGVLREQYHVDGKYVSIVCFGLIANEWEELLQINNLVR